MAFSLVDPLSSWSRPLSLHCKTGSIGVPSLHGESLVAPDQNIPPSAVSSFVLTFWCLPVPARSPSVSPPPILDALVSPWSRRSCGPLSPPLSSSWFRSFECTCFSSASRSGAVAWNILLMDSMFLPRGLWYMSYMVDKPIILSLFLGPAGLIQASPLLNFFVESVFEPAADSGRSSLLMVGWTDQLFDCNVLILGLSVVKFRSRSWYGPYASLFTR
jgi:hypothetical protein